MERNVRFSVVLGLSLLAGLLLPALPAGAKDWAAGTADWNVSGNWSPAGVPDDHDNVYIDNGGTAQVKSYYAYANKVYAGHDNGSSGTVELSNGWVLYTDYGIDVGTNGTGTFNHVSGDVYRPYNSTGDLILGYSGTGKGTYNFQNGNIYIYRVIVGRDGEGVFNHTGGTLYVGDASHADDLTIGDASSGYSGKGTYRLAGGQIRMPNSGSHIYVGVDSSYIGEGRFEWFTEGGISRSGGAETPTMYIGSNGTLAMGYDFSGIPSLVSGLQNGTLEVTNGATVTKTNDGIVSQVNYLRIGSGTGAGYGIQQGGTVQVGQNTYVGDGGAGVATQNGGSFSSYHLYLGTGSPGAQGTYRLKGGVLTVTSNIFGGTGTGTMVLDGGTLSLGGSIFSVTNLILGDEGGRSGSWTLGTGKTLTVGVLRVGNAGTGTFSQTGGTNNAGSLTIGGGSSYTMTGGALAVSGAAVVGEGGSATFDIGSRSPTVGSLTMRNGSITGSGTITASSGYTGENGSIGASLAGGVGLVKASHGGSAGSVTLSGVNTYTGPTTVRAGTLVAGANAPNGSAGAFGSATSAIVVADAGTQGGDNLSLLVNDAYTVGRAVTVNNYGAAVTLGGANASGTAYFGGAITLNRGVDLAAGGGASGTVQFSGLIGGAGKTALLTGTGNVKVAPAAAGTTDVNYTVGGGGGRLLGGSNTSGAVQFTGNITLNKEVTLTAASGGTAEFAGGTWTPNNNAVTVTGAGTSVVRISNTLNTGGAVAVSSGTLRVDGTVGGGGSWLTVANGASLQGGGTIGKPVVVNGTIAPGASTGVLTVNENLTLAGVSQFELQVYRRMDEGGPGAGYYDGIAVGGSGHVLTFGGTLNVVNFGTGPEYAAGQVYDLFDWGGNTPTGTFGTINLPTLGDGLQWKVFGSQRLDYATGRIEVESGTTDTHYRLSANLAVAPNVLLKGYVGATSSITCTGSGDMDTLDFTGLNAASGLGGEVSGASIDGSDVQHGATRTNAGLTFHGIEYNSAVSVKPRVATATNHSPPHGDAILDWANGTIVNVGMAKAGPGKDRLAFGPPLVGQGKGKTLPGGLIVRDYAGLASKTSPGTWAEEGQTVGTEAVICEGIDSAAGHTVSMEWRQRYDGMVYGVPGSEIPETRYLFSDVLRLTGMDAGPGNLGPNDRHQSDVFVLQMSYTDLDAPGRLHFLAYLDLGADHEVGGAGAAADQWLPAPLGNFGGESQPLVRKTWEAFRADHPGELSELLGCWGWEGDGSGLGNVWAVLDYNNAQFAPEPGSLLLLAGLAAAAIRRRGRN